MQLKENNQSSALKWYYHRFEQHFWGLDHVLTRPVYFVKSFMKTDSNMNFISNYGDSHSSLNHS